jgi:hypothetical protein
LTLDWGSLEERVRFDNNVSFIDDHGARLGRPLWPPRGRRSALYPNEDGQILEYVEAEEQKERKLEL